MNDLPREPQPPEDVDDFYRRTSALDPSRPGERVRSSVLAHAEGLAAQRARARQKRRRWQPAIFGTLAAAVLAGLVVAPHWLRLRTPVGTAAPPTPSAAERSQLAREELPATPPAAAPAARASGAPAPAGPPSVPHADAGEPAPAPSEAQLAPTDVMNKPVPPGDATADAVTSSEARAPAARAAAPPAAAAAQIAPRETLQLAADTGDLATLRRLLAANPDIDARDGQGRTALMHAVLHDQASAVELLLGAGASPSAADREGTTPLQAAEARGERAIVEALQRHGAH